MLYVLAVYLFFSACLSYRISGYDIISPTFVLSTLFLFCDLFSIIGNQQWHVLITGNLVVVFIIALTMIQFGEMFAISIIKNRKRNNEIDLFQNKSIISFSKIKLIIFILIDSAILWVYYNNLLLLVKSIGYSNGDKLIQYIRVATTVNDMSVNPIIAILVGYISGMAYIALYIFLNNFDGTIKSIKNNFLLLIPVVLYTGSSVISGARNGFIQIIVFVFMVCLLLYRRNNKRINVFKTLIISCITIFLFLLIFTNLGKLTGKTTDNNALNNILIYVGSSIVALGKWLANGIRYSKYIGIESFWGIRYFINKIDSSFYAGSFALNFIYFNNGSSTNIYTAFRSFLADFGYPGLMIIPFIISFIYSFCYQNTKKSGESLSIILYSYFFYYYVYMLFTPSVTSHWFTVSSISSLFWLLVMYWLFIYKKKENKYELSLSGGK